MSEQESNDSFIWRVALLPDGNNVIEIGELLREADPQDYFKLIAKELSELSTQMFMSIIEANLQVVDESEDEQDAEPNGNFVFE